MTLPGEVVKTGRSLQNAFLARHLDDAVLGSWTAAAETLNVLEREIHNLRPNLILEFGSGISTSCLARYMREVHGPVRRTLVVSVEESTHCCAETHATAVSLGLADRISIVHAPLERQLIGGKETVCYRLTNELRLLLERSSPDCVFVDGPGLNPDPLVRFGTLPLCRQFLAPRSAFYLDDALRDRELEVARLWSLIPGISVEGVLLVGHGLLVGRIENY